MILTDFTRRIKSPKSKVLDDLLDELGALVNYEVKVDMVSTALGQLAGEIVDIFTLR